MSVIHLLTSEIVEWIDRVWNDLEEVFAAIAEGEIR
jgi:hypothetical protein